MEESRAITKYTEWINAKGIDPETRRELLNIIGSPDEITDRFDRDLAFGTAGLRARMAAGSNRINRYTIGQAALGVAGIVLEQEEAGKGMVISYDSRNHSREFAEVTARIFARCGIKVFFSDVMRPVPMLSYAIRYYQAAGGVMITASHNTREYNGFKVYGSDGGQIDPKRAERIQASIQQSENIFDVMRDLPEFTDLTAAGRIQVIGSGWDQAYHSMLLANADPGKIKSGYKERVRIVYTPLYGSGAAPVKRALNENGFTRVFEVTEEWKPNGDFPGLAAPNPEKEECFREAKKWASAVMADVILATDPDSDRLGVAIPDNKGGYTVLTGNQIGVLLMEYLLSTREGRGRLTGKEFCAASNVSSRLAGSIAERYGVTFFETMTGSKYIAELIREREEQGDEKFCFGFEEGHGYMIGSSVRDKDAIAAAVAIAEMTAISKAYGNRLMDQLKAIHRLYGFAAEKTVQITREGPAGEAAIRRLMAHYRSLDGKLGAASQDLYYKDVKKYTDFLPEADMLLYELGGRDWIAIRPSGTEPKLKVYLGFYGEKFAAESRLSRISKMLLDDINRVLDAE